MLAAFVLVSLNWFRTYSILLTSHVPVLLFGLILVWAWLRWREDQRLRWALLMGVAAGWAAITRPADALVYAVPVGVAIAWELLKRRPRRWPAVPALLLAEATPFLVLQVVFEMGVTGHPFRSPYGYYLDRDQPNSSFGFHRYDPSAQPVSTLPQKRESYDHWCPYLAAHTPAHVPELWVRHWLPMMADTTTQCRVLIAFIPIALLGLRDRRRGVLLATLPLFVAIYCFNPIFLEHYPLLVIPVVIFSILLGGWTLAAGAATNFGGVRTGAAHVVGDVVLGNQSFRVYPANRHF
ncbi:MAG: Dolichyl-phosphate-mannose-protein mannosyltransferase [Phycisphaerales bacterium]|nr:Dolichyl-phosphate-mannose-protein mannosyltransferase [Phycisphaerales bacterium]